MPVPAYRVLDHTADMAFEVEAPEWPRLLEAATAALGHLILAGGGEGRPEERPVRVSGGDREDILVAWLTEVILNLEEDGFLASGARVERADEREAAGALLGRRLDPSHEPPDRVVKAVTHHDLVVHVGGPGRPWKAAVVLDL